MMKAIEEMNLPYTHSVIPTKKRESQKPKIRDLDSLFKAIGVLLNPNKKRIILSKVENGRVG